MNSVRTLLASLGSGIRKTVGVAAVACIFWGIAYRLFLGFTPLWLDIATTAASILGLFVLWALGSNREFDYSARSNQPPSDPSD